MALKEYMKQIGEDIPEKILTNKKAKLVILISKLKSRRRKNIKGVKRTTSMNQNIHNSTRVFLTTSLNSFGQRDQINVYSCTYQNISISLYIRSYKET